jgi:hypothetical protein
MKPDGEIENLLAAMPVPRVVEGSHRAGLKQNLLHQMQKEAPVMLTWKRVLAVCCAVLVLAAVGWAAQKAVQKFFVVHQEANGQVVGGSNDPNYTQDKADQHWKEIQDLIAQGKYELVKVEDLGEGKRAYCYRFVLSNGETVGFARSEPLPDVGDLSKK